MIVNNVETHVAQRAFRQVLEAFARPGTIGQIDAFPKSGETTPVLGCFETAVRLFVDQAVTFCAVGAASHDVSCWLTVQTHAKQAQAQEADFVLVPVASDAVHAEAIAQAKPGTLEEPEKGATVVLLVDSISAVPAKGLTCLDLSGPGIEKTAELYVSQAEWAHARAERADEYPCGIEVLLVDDDGNVAALPRTTRIENTFACLGGSKGEVA